MNRIQPLARTCSRLTPQETCCFMAEKPRTYDSSSSPAVNAAFCSSQKRVSLSSAFVYLTMDAHSLCSPKVPYRSCNSGIIAISARGQGFDVAHASCVGVKEHPAPLFIHF